MSRNPVARTVGVFAPGRRASRVRRAGLVLLLAVAAAFLASAAWGFWTEEGDGAAVAATGTLNPPANVVVSAPRNSTTVTVSWTGSGLDTGEPAAYALLRVRDSDQTTFPACGTSLSEPTSAVSCEDTGVTDGRYHYRVIAVFGSWTATGPDSSSVTVVNDDSAPSAWVSSISPAPNGNGYNSSSPVVVNLAASAGFGVASISYTLDSDPVITSPTDTAAVSVAGDGIHTLTYSAQDTNGVDSQAGTVLVRIDTVAPEPPSTPVMMTASDTGSSATDGITKVTTPKFTGTAESGATVTLYDGSTPVGSGVATSGSYAITSSTLTSGGHAMTARTTDLAGNTGPASIVTDITIDTTPPVAPSTPTLTEASDSGSSSTDRLTNVTTPTFTGTAESGVTVTLYNGAVVVGTATATDGTYTVTSSTLTTGAKVMTARATDPAGNLSTASPSTTITIDVTAPGKPGTPVLAAASDSGRSATDRYTRVDTPTISGIVTAGTTVTVYDGTTVIGTPTPVGTAWSITSSPLADAVHPITVTATDPAGNTSVSSSSIAVTVDTVAPAAPGAPVLYSTSDTGKSSSDRITFKTTPVITGSNESKAIVTLYDGTGQVGRVTTTSTTSSVTTSPLSDGAHTLTSTATDVAGNLGPASAGTTITIDTVAPAAPSTPALATASDTGISSTDGITKATKPTFTGTAESGATVGLFDAGVATGTAVTATGGAYSATSGTLTNGSHTITAKTTDVAGNIGPASGGTPVTVDTVLPTVTLNQAAGQPDPATGSSPIGFTATFSETVTGFTGASVTRGGTAPASTATISGTGPSYTVALSGMTKTGTVITTIAAGKVFDIAGNGNSLGTFADNTVTYNDNVPPAAPTTPLLAAASDTGSSNSDLITNDTTMTFTGTAEIGSTVRLFDGVTQVGSVVATAGIYTITTSALTNGNHTISSTATDSSGNVSPASSGTTVTVDTVAPTVTLNQAVGQADPTTTSPINFTATFSESVVGFTSTDVTYSTGTAGANSSTITGTGPVYTVAVSGMTKTGTVIPAIAASAVKDIAGNANTAATSTDKTVTYTDNVAPVVTITGFAGGASQTATVSGTAGLEPGDALTVTVVLCTQNVYPCTGANLKATLSGVPVNATTGAWTVTSASLGTTPVLYARATQADLSGNAGNSAAAGAIAIP